MPSYSSRNVAAALDLTAYTEVEICRWSPTSVLSPIPYENKGASEPTHDLKFQDAAGNWFEIAAKAILNPYQAGAMGGGADDTGQVQTVLNLAQVRGSRVDLGGGWSVSKISISTGNVFFEIVGNCVFELMDTIAQKCGFEITRGNFIVSGSITVFGLYKLNYDAGIWVHNDVQLQNADLSKFIVVGCKVGLRVGDAAHPASVTSEITVNMPRSYGVPRPLQVEGAQTYLSIMAACPISADGFGGDATWNSQVFRAVTNIGSNLTIIGGEVIQTSSGAATDWLVEMQPCNQGADLSWGRVTMNAVVIETGGPLCLISNPLGLTGSHSANDKPFFKVVGCFGYHSQDNSPFIDVHPNFYGDIVWSESDVWKNGAARTQPNVLCRGNLTQVYVDDRGFGNGFKGAIDGTSGGISHFSKRTIMHVIGLPATTLPIGVTTLKWQSFIANSDTNRFQGLYSLSTGAFTVPAGGLKSVMVSAQIYANVTGLIVIRDNGAEVARGTVLNGAAKATWNAGNLTAGRAVTVDVIVTAGPTLPSTSNFLNTFVIEAYN